MQSTQQGMDNSGCSCREHAEIVNADTFIDRLFSLALLHQPQCVS